MRLGIGPSISKVAAVMRTFVVPFLKDNLKIFFDFKNTDLEHVGRGSASFDGTNDVITITDNSVFSFGDGSTDQGFSITAWVKMVDATNFQIMNKGIFNTDGEWNFRTNSSDQLVFALYDESVSSTHESVVSSAITSNQNQWIHVAATYDGRGGTSANDGMELYINGVNSTNSRSGAGTYVAMENLAGNVTIGAGNSAFANGSIAQVGIWQRQLSSSEVLNIVYKDYSDLSGTELTHLFAWYPLLTDADSLVGVEGLTKYDGSNSGATFNSSVYGNNAPPKPRGVDNSSAALADQIGSGSALLDASEEDKIKCGGAAVTAYPFSITGWVKPVAGSNLQVLTLSDISASNVYFSLSYNGASDNAFQLQARNTTLRKINSATYSTVSGWYHLAGIFSSATDRTLYVNGIKDHSGAEALDSVTFSSDIDTTTIGALDRPTPAYGEGNVAQVGLWSRALSQEEVQEISQKQYSELTTSEKTNLISWWGLDSSLTGQNQSIVLDENDTTTTSIALNGNESALANVTGTTTVNITGNLTAGKLYKLVFTKAETLNSGYDQWREGGGSYTTIYATSALGAGTYTLYFQAVESQPLQWQSGGGTPWQGSITNISLEEYDGNPGVLK